jgi:addiction module RelE/StbE family toxin
MTYKVVVEPGAQADIDKAFEYYNSVTDNDKVLSNFWNDIEQAYSALKTNPFYQVRSKHYRALPLKKFPYLLFFEVLEKQRIVKVLALFNTPQDHKKYP